jgi:hypothetical protein
MAYSLTELREAVRDLGSLDPVAIDARFDAVEADVLALQTDLTALDNRTPKILGLARITTAQASIGATPTDLTGLTVTATVAANRRIRITASGRTTQQTAAGSQSLALLFDGGGIGLPFSESNVAVNAIKTYGYSTVQLAPAAGSHTWKLTLSTSGGTCTHALSAVIPGLLLVEDIGPN